MKTALEESAKKQTSSAGRWWGRSVIYGKEDEHATPYMTRYWIGRLRLHLFHRGDQDPDCHDHPWDFWTFPFTPYVEEVAEPTGWGEYEVNGRTYSYLLDSDEARYSPLAAERGRPTYRKRYQIVPAWRLTFRPAEHTHRVLGRLDPHDIPGDFPPELSVIPGNIVTLVWRSRDRRKWGFLKDRDGKWCWVHWKSYVFGGGKSAPCE